MVYRVCKRQNSQQGKVTGTVTKASKASTNNPRSQFIPKIATAILQSTQKTKLPFNSTTQQFSFEWSHHMILPRDSKFATLSHRRLHKLVDYGNGNKDSTSKEP